jgi:hypothetical protein
VKRDKFAWAKNKIIGEALAKRPAKVQHLIRESLFSKEQFYKSFPSVRYLREGCQAIAEAWRSHEEKMRDVLLPGYMRKFWLATSSGSYYLACALLYEACGARRPGTRGNFNRAYAQLRTFLPSFSKRHWTVLLAVARKSPSMEEVESLLGLVYSRGEVQEILDELRAFDRLSEETPVSP